MIYNIAKSILFVFFKILFRFQVVGRENLPSKDGFIVAANHVSYLDPIAVGLTTSKKVYFLAKESLFRNAVFGFLLRKLCSIPIKTTHGMNVETFRKSLNILSMGNNIVIFPEGRRSADGSIQEMRAGVGFLAIKSRKPVIPVFITGTEKALPVKAKFIKPKKVYVYIGKALIVGDNENNEDFSKRVEASIRELAKQTKRV
ncbi:MAG: lysophospholipid acyltransferase family protein [Candidatus Omnitrophota bacterium]